MFAITCRVIDCQVPASAQATEDVDGFSRGRAAEQHPLVRWEFPSRSSAGRSGVPALPICLDGRSRMVIAALGITF
jgi:hypothetical protein